MSGQKVIGNKGVIEGYGKVWLDADAVSNLFSLLEVVKKGMHVSYDSDIADKFRVTTQDGRTIKFPVDERGLYVKETYQQMKKRLDKLEKDEKDVEDTPPPLIRVDLDSDDEDEDKPSPLARFESYDSDLEDEYEVEMSEGPAMVHTSREGFTD